ncbi:MAG: carbohydrate-binding module family 14 protein [Aestuariivita sp.]|uniref:carbohydrate-binding module family 14 protein n=1 Tax=Aestuariivita sp. TaxID=1872407 RepID=UPI003BB02AF4
MTIKTILTALALTVLPASAFAMCSDKNYQAMSCAEGSVWDINTQTCVKQVMS